MASVSGLHYQGQDFLEGEDGRLFREMVLLLKDMRALSLSNHDYFSSKAHRHASSFVEQFNALNTLLYEIESCIEHLLVTASDFDFDASSPGNGFRTFVFIVRQCCSKIYQLLRHLDISKSSLFFRARQSLQELSDYVKLLGNLHFCCTYLEKYMDFCSPGQLFVDEEFFQDPSSIEFLKQAENIDQEIFYGHCMGFQFCASMQRPLMIIGVALASFSDAYRHNSLLKQLTSGVVSFGTYFMNSEIRAKVFARATKTCTIDFCKAFWSSDENIFVRQLTESFLPFIPVNTQLSIPPREFSLPSISEASSTVSISPPTVHNGLKPLHCRLLSNHHRRGMEQIVPSYSHHFIVREDIAEPASPYLIVHAHGGGFVAQSSKSHEVYLRDWAMKLDVPIFSIDYSLAPESPFPRASEECFYAYCWARQNCHILGSTGEKVIVVGDSAGGNIMMSVLARCAEHRVQMPDACVAMYTPMQIAYRPTPSRLLCMMDPLLPAGIMAQCLMAYVGIKKEDLVKKIEDAQQAEQEPDHHVPTLSPVFRLEDEKRNHLEKALSADEDTVTTPPPSSPGYLRSFSTPSPTPVRLRRSQSVIQGMLPHTPPPTPTSPSSPTPPLENPWEYVRQIPFPTDPFLSPLLLGDATLKMFPFINFITCHLDPCLDDDVTMAKRLRDVGRPVRLDILHDVPHGFLNFSGVSSDCKHASNLVVKRIQQAFGILKK